MPESPTPAPETPPQTIAWIPSTEAVRAQLLLDTHPRLVAAKKELDWLLNAPLLTHAQKHVAATATKAGLAATRPAQTDDLAAVVKEMRKPLTELRGVMKKKFKAAYEGYYPQFGLEKVSKNWQLPKDRDDLETALRDFLLPALTTHGFQADPDTGTAVWQPLLDRLSTALDAAGGTDEARSLAVGESSPLDITTDKALRCIVHLLMAHNPDGWESTLRGWGWRKTSF